MYILVINIIMWKDKIPYSFKFPWSNIFVIFVNLMIITKIFVTEFSSQQLEVQQLTLHNHK